MRWDGPQMQGITNGHRCRLPHLDGVAVDGLSAAGHIHRPGDLQDVVWHVTWHAFTVTNLPPLLPVVKDLER